MIRPLPRLVSFGVKDPRSVLHLHHLPLYS